MNSYFQLSAQFQVTCLHHCIAMSISVEVSELTCQDVATALNDIVEEDNHIKNFKIVTSLDSILTFIYDCGKSTVYERVNSIGSAEGVFENILILLNRNLYCSQICSKAFAVIHNLCTNGRYSTPHKGLPVPATLLLKHFTSMRLKHILLLQYTKVFWKVSVRKITFLSPFFMRKSFCFYITKRRIFAFVILAVILLGFLDGVMRRTLCN
jgi:hypothetical protein